MATFTIVFFRILGLSSLIIAIIALILTNIWHSNQNGTNYAVDRSLESLVQNISHLQMENTLLQSQLVEILMGPNETIIQEGIFVWSVGGKEDNDPGILCGFTSSFITVSGFTINTAGAGYRVGDLVTVNDVGSISAVQFSANAVLKVTSVGLMGEVLSFDVLTPGCLTSNPSPSAADVFITMSVQGNGLTVLRNLPPYPPIGIDQYHLFSTPQKNPVAPLQYANYSLRSIMIESVEYIILYVFPPEFPIVTRRFPPSRPSTALTVVLYEFEPAIPNLQALGYYNYYFPLTRKNVNAINLTDDTNCYTTNLNCWLDAEGNNGRTAPNAVVFNNKRYGTNLQISDAYIKWNFMSTLPPYDYTDENAVLQLNYPLMFVLPAV